MTIKKIAVLGAGHMGSWFIRELKQNYPVAVFDINTEKLNEFEGITPLKDISDLKTFQPQLLINAVSLKHTVEAFEKAVPFLPEGCLIADIASIKGNIPVFYLKQKFPFVSIHPMFGPHFANLHQIKDENVILISESNDQGIEFFKDFFKIFNLKIFEYSFAVHDELMADALTLPFSSSIVFSACKSTSTVPGTTYRRHKEIAWKLLQEDDYLLAEVLFNPTSFKQLEKITTSLEFLKHVIKAKDYEEAERYFDRLRKNFQ